tara:strand:+ start:102 stop:383 length:282 start_codon:yes stop_codon:yes gene_type:complete
MILQLVQEVLVLQEGLVLIFILMVQKELILQLETLLFLLEVVMELQIIQLELLEEVAAEAAAAAAQTNLLVLEMKVVFLHRKEMTVVLVSLVL